MGGLAAVKDGGLKPSQTDLAAGRPAELSPAQVFEALSADPKAMLVDVRSAAEWSFVGQPEAPRPLLSVEWQSFPGMRRNPDFLAQAEALIAEAGGDRTSTLYILCRSGGRSRAAAQMLIEAGYLAVNVAEGFEGDLDAQTQRRNKLNGWRHAGLPWRQS